MRRTFLLLNLELLEKSNIHVSLVKGLDLTYTKIISRDIFSTVDGIDQGSKIGGIITGAEGSWLRKNATNDWIS